jgi:hypothetical protein
MSGKSMRKLKAKCLIAWEAFPYKQALNPDPTMAFKTFWRKFKKEYRHA